LNIFTGRITYGYYCIFMLFILFSASLQLALFLAVVVVSPSSWCIPLIM
jgi:hypothetical protein